SGRNIDIPLILAWARLRTPDRLGRPYWTPGSPRRRDARRRPRSAGEDATTGRPDDRSSRSLECDAAIRAFHLPEVTASVSSACSPPANAEQVAVQVANRTV